MMSGIERSVELFNQAFHLAWAHVSQYETQPSTVSQLLGEAIQRRLKAGMTDAVKIAAEAVTELQKSYRDIGR